MPNTNQQSASEETRTQDAELGVNPDIEALLQTPAAIAELGRRAEERARHMAEADRRRNEVVEFASRLVGGTAERPFGLNVQPSDVVAVLLSLPESQSKAVQKLLVAALDGAISYVERGYASGSVNLGLRPLLPKEYRPAMEKWLSAGKNIREFFAVNEEVGNYEDFNLSEYEKEK